MNKKEEIIELTKEIYSLLQQISPIIDKLECIKKGLSKEEKEDIRNDEEYTRYVNKADKLINLVLYGE